MEKYETFTNMVAKSNSVNNYLSINYQNISLKDRVAMHNCSCP